MRNRPAQRMLFAFPAAIAVPIIAGILLGGPVVGFVVAGVLALVIVVAAVRLGPNRRRVASDTDVWRRAAALRFIVPLVLAVAGIAVAAMTSGTLRIIGWGTIAVACTLAISLVFLEVGHSEDRARARGDARPQRKAAGAAGSAEVRQPGRAAGKPRPH